MEENEVCGWYASPVRSKDTFSEASWMVFRIEPDHLRLVEKARDFLSVLSERSESRGEVTIRGCIVVTVFLEMTLEEMRRVVSCLPDEWVNDGEGQAQLVKLTSPPDFKKVEDKWVWSSSCAGIRAFPGDVYVVAQSRDTSEEVESDELGYLFDGDGEVAVDTDGGRGSRR